MKVISLRDFPTVITRRPRSSLNQRSPADFSCFYTSRVFCRGERGLEESPSILWSIRYKRRLLRWVGPFARPRSVGWAVMEAPSNAPLATTPTQARHPDPKGSGIHPRNRVRITPREQGHERNSAATCSNLAPVIWLLFLRRRPPKGRGGRRRRERAFCFVLLPSSRLLTRLGGHPRQTRRPNNDFVSTRLIPADDLFLLLSIHIRGTLAPFLARRSEVTKMRAHTRLSAFGEGSLRTLRAAVSK